MNSDDRLWVKIKDNVLVKLTAIEESNRFLGSMMGRHVISTEIYSLLLVCDVVIAV